VVLNLETGVRFSEDPVRSLVKENFVSGRVTKNYGRGEVYFTPYYSKFTALNGVSGDQQTSKYGAGVGVKHEFFTDTIGTANFAAERFDYNGGTRATATGGTETFAGSHTNRLAADYGLSYLMPYEITAGLSHRYFRYFSPSRSFDNREVNRVMLELRKVF
jgi:uncharacterized protein (PEP-CTERM system associated)